jgi:zinc-ribbon domain
MFCVKCGTQLPDRAKHCFECGTSVGEAQPKTAGVRRKIVCIIGDKGLFQRAVFLVEPDGQKREIASDSSSGRLEAMLLSDGWTRVPGGMSARPTYEKWIEE